MDNHVGPYRILRLINRGGQGSVYLGYDERLRRRVAIKIHSVSRQRTARREALREARLVAGIQSPRVVGIYDVIEAPGYLALVMEYVPGCNLEELLAGTRPSLASVLTITADIATALALARQSHLVHRDLKASNVLVTEDGRAKLTDFGIAGLLDESEGCAAQGGSPSGVSPEQYLGRSVDERSDLFSLGVLIYRMLAGEHPFFSDGRLDQVKLLHADPPPLTVMRDKGFDIPQVLSDLVAQLLEKEPAERPRNTRHVRQVVRAAWRELPLAVSNSLAAEAQAAFRVELQDDLPAQVPRRLGQAGRSRLVRGSGRLATVRHWLVSMSWPLRLGLGIVLAGAISVPVVIAFQDRAHAISFVEPELRFPAGAAAPVGISGEWLLQEVKQVLVETRGRLRVIGPVGAEPTATLYSKAAVPVVPAQPRDIFSITLRCAEDLCVLAMQRESAGERFNQQAVLFPDMSEQQWRDIVHRTTAGLYP